MLQRQTSGKQLHFLIFERQTEEESVLTIANLLLSSGFRVTVFISHHIDTLIGHELRKLEIAPKILPENLKNSLNEVTQFIKTHPVDLIIFTRFSVFSYSDYFLYRRFVKQNPVCSLVGTYDRWFRKFPPVEFNGLKILKRSKILEWYFCKKIFKYFYCYFVSDIHPVSKNPIKEFIRNSNHKPILDFPFKVMEREYKPEINFRKPVFVIPGSVSVERRDYEIVLKIFSDPEIQQEEWELIFLGRPIGEKGKKIIEQAKKINARNKNNKITVFENSAYIPRTDFEFHINRATHIIAPVTPKMYRYGKDSGALYDILKYNKIGIVNREYFYADDLPELKSVYTYHTSLDFKELILNVTNRNVPVLNFELMNDYFSKQQYVNNIKMEFNKLFGVSN